MLGLRRADGPRPHFPRLGNIPRCGATAAWNAVILKTGSVKKARMTCTSKAHFCEFLLLQVAIAIEFR